MARTVAGRCHRCNVAYEWQFQRRKGKLPRLLKWAWCRVCGSKLQQTTRGFRQGRWERRRRPLFTRSLLHASMFCDRGLGR